MLNIIEGILLSITVVLLIGGGIFFSLKLNFPQLRVIKLLKGFKIKDQNLVSPLQSLMISLAARIGVGSIAGITLAIYLGGPGTVLWIAITCIITSINTYCECYLGIKYQEKDSENYKGGPAFYIEKGLKNKKLAIIYSILIIISYLVGFMTIQANTINISINTTTGINKLLIAVIVSIVSFLSISKGLKSINSIVSKIVPIMGITYVLLGIIIIIINSNKLPSIFILIITDAMNIKKTLPTSFIIMFLIGIQKGAFITESGLGTSSISVSCINTKDKINLSLMQIIGVYFTIFIVCTITVLIILTSDYQNIIFNNINGIEITQYSLNYHLGIIGNYILIVLIIFLAYSTIIAGYYYGESNLKYLIKSIKNYHLIILKILTSGLLFVGSLINASLLWKTVDILIEILIIINMYTLLKLRKEIIFDYTRKK